MKKLLVSMTLFSTSAVLLVGCNQPNNTVSLEGSSPVPVVTQQEESRSETSDSIVAEGTAQVASSGSFIDYSPSAIAQATENDGKAVLFFHASWCSTCKAAEKEILENADQIPSNLTIIKTDFDSMRDLKKQYSVVNQHTFIQVDAEGNEVNRWVGGGLKTILQRV